MRLSASHVGRKIDTLRAPGTRQIALDLCGVEQCQSSSGEPSFRRSRLHRWCGAAAYVRMSTDQQRYSTFHQLTAIKAYAADHNLTIVHVYADEGISGLQIKNCPGLRSDAMKGRGELQRRLVYDISRWGQYLFARRAAI